MRSANASSSVASAKASVSPKSSPSKGPLAKTNSINATSDHEAAISISGMLHKRSASFHYPDGTSRITHSVYSSEEDFNDEDEDDEEPRYNQF